jgi:integrase
VNHHIQLMRHMLFLAVSWEMLDSNVLARIGLLPLDNKVENNLDDAQVARLTDVLQTDENRLVCLIVMFLLSTGARLREGLCAKWGQVDQANRVWKIPASNTKAKKLKHLPLNDSAMWVIGQLGTESKSEFLFPSPVTGQPFSGITRTWMRLRKKAGLPSNVRIHDLRHTYASRLLCAGESMAVVGNLLGHADVRTTSRYAHFSMSTKQRAANVASLPLRA